MTEQAADEHRTGLCVRACEGIPTEKLEKMVAAGDTIQTSTTRAVKNALGLLSPDELEGLLQRLPDEIAGRLRRTMRE